MAAASIVGLIEEITVTGTQSSKTVLAKCDTGATRTSIDSDLAQVIGTGPESDSVTVRSSNGREDRSVYQFNIELAGHHHSVTASVTDRTEMDYPCIIGRDILSNYLVDSSDGASD